jgi:hypothetical protein
MGREVVFIVGSMDERGVERAKSNRQARAEELVLSGLVCKFVRGGHAARAGC